MTADSFLVSDEGALHAALAGRTLTIRTREHAGPPGGEDTIDGAFRVTVVRVKRAVVGLDAGGLFSGLVCVVEDERRDLLHSWPLTFYADGQVCDADEREVGRCDLAGLVGALTEPDDLPGSRQDGAGPGPGLSPGSVSAVMTAAERHAHPLLAGLLEAERILGGGK